MKGFETERARTILLRATRGEMLPAGLVGTLREHKVSGGWLRATGVVQNVVLRAYRDDSTPEMRRIAGPLLLASLEGGIGLANGEPSFSMRVVLSRAGEMGPETIVGELESATIVALEGLIIAVDDLPLVRTMDETARVSLIGLPGPTPPASALSENRNMPQRPAKRVTNDEPTIVPEAGDIVEHFAFGQCEVVRSDGDRLHLRIGKEGRVKEIALEMLRVTPLETIERTEDEASGARGTQKGHYRLDRKIL